MRARDLIWPCTTVQPHASLLDAAKLLVHERAPAVVAVSDDGHPLAVVPAAQILAAVLPESVREDPLLAAVAAESLDPDVRVRAASHRLTDVLPRRLPAPAVVGPDASPVQMAALMARTGGALVLVVDYEGDQPNLLGTVDAATLLHHYL